jgi:clan AA aspartic protease
MPKTNRRGAAIKDPLGEKPVGRFAVEFVVANQDDKTRQRLGQLKPEEVRQITISGVVDSGATRLVLPKAVVDQLGLTRLDKVKVRYADGRTAKRDLVQQVFVELLGRKSVFTATSEPGRETALIGAFVLEELDFLIDPTKQRLVPRDPDFIISEIE